MRINCQNPAQYPLTKLLKTETPKEITLAKLPVEIFIDKINAQKSQFKGCPVFCSHNISSDICVLGNDTSVPQAGEILYCFCEVQIVNEKF